MYCHSKRNPNYHRSVMFLRDEHHSAQVSDQVFQTLDRSNPINMIRHGQIFKSSDYCRHNNDNRFERNEMSFHYSLYQGSTQATQFEYDSNNYLRTSFEENCYRQSSCAIRDSQSTSDTTIAPSNSGDLVQGDLLSLTRLSDEIVIQRNINVSPGEANSSQHNSISDDKAKTQKEQKPTRPRSSYNYFFQEQRRILLGLQDDGEEDESLETNENEHSEETCTKQKKRKRGRPVNPTTKKRRPHHRLISFCELGKTVGSKWKKLSEKDKEKYEVLADKDKIRYREEMKIYNEMQTGTDEDLKTSIVASIDQLLKDQSQKKSHSIEENICTDIRNKNNSLEHLKYTEQQRILQDSCRTNEQRPCSHQHKKPRHRCSHEQSIFNHSFHSLAQTQPTTSSITAQCRISETSLYHLEQRTNNYGNGMIQNHMLENPHCSNREHQFYYDNNEDGKLVTNSGSDMLTNDSLSWEEESKLYEPLPFR